ncbi:MAG: class I SAM-dependent methyltransferase [Candidatus Marinimicrobia bacterium]|nr:class I SAM-dependent methyltransferase [Candidatus Neomarinimicrobiota bacterium]
MNYKPVPPYTESSLIYNRLMEEVDYPGWCQYILDLADEFSFETNSMYDISCGTGTFLHLFPAADKFGIDISEPMIEEAKKNYPELELSVGNMLQPPPRDVDIYLNIHDALNYISNFDAILEHLHYMDKHLNKGQVYIFDFALPGVMKNYFMDTSYEDTNNEGISFKRQNHYDIKNQRAITDLYIYHPDGRSFHEQHIQRIYDFEEIKKLSVEFPSRTFIFLEEFSFEEAHEASNRLLIIML